MSRPRRPTPESEPAAAAEKPLRTDARRNRERVINAARKLIELRGLGVEMDEIARRAGVGVGTIYRHFPTKESLIHSVATSFFDRLVAAARERADAPDPGEAFFEYLSVLAEELLAKVSLGHAFTKSHVSPADTTRVREELGAAMDALLSRAKKAGAVRADVTVADVMLLMKSTLANPEGTVSAADVRRRLFEIVCDGLRTPRGK